MNYTAASFSILTACKEKGLKQSVIEKALTAFAGFRSIQAAKSVNKTPSVTDTPEHMDMLPDSAPLSLIIAQQETAYLRGIIYNAYPSSDLLALDFAHQVLSPTADVGDGLFTVFWELAHTDPTALLKALSSSLKWLDVAIRVNHKPTTHTVADIQDVFPNNCPIVDFIRCELREGSEGTPIDDLHECLGRLLKTVRKDLIAMQRALMRSGYAMQLMRTS
jgi:hypothetical protein